MNEKMVISFLSALGGTVTNTSNTWVTCTCVMAKWLHSGGVDNHPSSGMTIKQSEESRYNCYSCGTKGTAYELYRAVKLANGGASSTLNFKEALDVLTFDDDEDNFNIVIPDYEKEINKYQGLHDFSEVFYNEFDLAYDHPYVVYRGITHELAKELDVRVDTYRNRILFPIRDWEGVLMGVHGRTFLEDVEPRYYSYPYEGRRNPDVFMGEHHTNLDEPIILVEGQFDYAKVYPYYQNVLSSQTTSIQDNKLKRISTASEIITIFDRGVGGDLGREKVSKYFKTIPVTHIEVPEPYGDLGEMGDADVYELLQSID